MIGLVGPDGMDRYEPPTVEERTPIGKPLIGASEINFRVVARPRVR